MKNNSRLIAMFIAGTLIASPFAYIFGLAVERGEPRTWKVEDCMMECGCEIEEDCKEYVYYNNVTESDTYYIRDCKDGFRISMWVNDSWSEPYPLGVNHSDESRNPFSSEGYIIVLHPTNLTLRLNDDNESEPIFYLGEAKGVLISNITWSDMND